MEFIPFNIEIAYTSFVHQPLIKLKIFNDTSHKTRHVVTIYLYDYIYCVYVKEV